MAVSLGLILSGISILVTQIFAQMANNTTTSTTTHSAQPFVFVYKVTGAFPGLNQRTLIH